MADLSVTTDATINGSVSKSEEVDRYSGNPTITGSNRIWARDVREIDGKYYVLVASDPIDTELWIGETMHDLTEYSGNPVASSTETSQIMGVVEYDGYYWGVTYYKVDADNRRAHLWYSENYVDWQEYSGNPIVAETELPWLADDQGLIHPHWRMQYGWLEFDMIDQRGDATHNQQMGIVSDRDPTMDNFIDHGIRFQPQPSWEDSAITNTHIKTHDGIMYCHYSAGPSGSDRDLGVRFVEDHSQWDNADSYLDGPIVTPNGGTFEDGYVNIGDNLDGKMLYFGYGTEETGILEYEYQDLSTVLSISITNAPIDVTVYEDATGDGNADNTATVTLDSGTNTYTLSGFDGSSGNDVWIEGNFQTGDISTSSTLNSVDVSTASTTIPITIDGTQVVDITIDGTAVTGVTIDGSVVF